MSDLFVYMVIQALQKWLQILIFFYSVMVVPCLYGKSVSITPQSFPKVLFLLFCFFKSCVQNILILSLVSVIHPCDETHHGLYILSAKGVVKCRRHGINCCTLYMRRNISGQLFLEMSSNAHLSFTNLHDTLLQQIVAKMGKKHVIWMK